MSADHNMQGKTLRDVFGDLWRAKYALALGMVFGLVLAAGFVMSATPHYKSHMLISPANPMNSAETSSLMADDNLFALRYLVQRVGVSNSSEFLRFENTYDGASVAEVLLQDPKIVSGLKLDQAFEFSDAKENWNAAELSSYIDDRVKLEPVGASAMRRMVYLHPRADFGQYFLNAIHAATDNLIRKTISTEATQRIVHLQASVRQTNNPDHRRALTSLLMEQERLRMLASVGTPYAAAVVERPASSAKTVWPSAALVFAAFIAVGGLAGFIIYSAFNPAAVQGRGAHSPAAKPVSAKRWFKSDSGNANRPLSGQAFKALSDDEARDVG